MTGMRQAAGEYLALRRALGYRLAQDGQLELVKFFVCDGAVD